MKYILYNKLYTYKNTKLDFVYCWVIDYLTNRRYIKFNSYYTLLYVFQILLKNNDHMLNYNYIKNRIQPRCIHLLSKIFKYITQVVKVHGVGYKLNRIKDTQLISLTVGYSHKLYLKLPDNISFTLTNDNTCIELTSYNYILLTTVISQLKKLHKYDPYKGKGFKLAGEIFTPKFYKK